MVPGVVAEFTELKRVSWSVSSLHYVKPTTLHKSERTVSGPGTTRLTTSRGVIYKGRKGFKYRTRKRRTTSIKGTKKTKVDTDTCRSLEGSGPTRVDHRRS